MRIRFQMFKVAQKFKNIELNLHRCEVLCTHTYCIFQRSPYTYSKDHVDTDPFYIRLHVEEKTWIRICIKRMRIRITGKSWCRIFCTDKC